MEIFESFLTIVFILQALTCTNCIREEQILDDILSPEKYDKRIKPKSANSIDGAPIEVNINMYILSLNLVHDNDMEYSMQVYFRQFWKDSRLAFQRHNKTIKYLTVDDASVIWTPDLFFTNEKESFFHNIMLPNQFIRIYPDGKVAYSRRITLTLQCLMEFSKFPFDVQECPFDIESYGMTRKEIILDWKQPDPVHVTEHLQSTPLFKLVTFWTYSRIVQTGTEEYSHLSLQMKFSRNTSYYLMHIFIPCAMLVIISWFSFWINPKKITTRTVVGLGSLLTMSLLIAHANDEFPKVSYTRAMDVFTGISLSFSLCALIMTILVHFKKSKKSTDKKQTDVNPDIEQNESVLEKHGDKFYRLKLWISEQVGDGIDVGCRILFPVGYLFFNIVYWAICLSFKL